MPDIAVNILYLHIIPLPLPQEVADLQARHATEVAGCKADSDLSVQQLKQQYRREMQQASEHTVHE